MIQKMTYSLTVYVLDYDPEAGVCCERAAFTTYHESESDAGGALGLILQIHDGREIPGTSSFTAAETDRCWTDERGFHSETTERTVIDQKNCDRLGHDLHYGEEDEA